MSLKLFLSLMPDFTAKLHQIRFRKPDCNSGRRSADIRYFIRWLTTRRPRSFDSTDRFEIGRYELVSIASSPGFFTIGVTNASLKTTGKWPSDSERLDSSTTNGAMTSMTCLSTDVGIGSAAENLSGTKVVEQRRCHRSSASRSTALQRRARSHTDAGGASLVFNRTLATFSAKNWLNASTSIAELSGTHTAAA